MKTSIVCALGLAVVLQADAPPAAVWRQSGFEAFSQGTFEDSGANMYVSRRGVQMINRLDLNRDGHLDIAIGNGHAHTEDEDLYIYLNNGEDLDPLSRISFPAQGAVHGLLADLDRDGHNDLVVVNSQGGMTFRVDTFIYYGSEKGFAIERRRRLQAWRGMSVATADWNGDGWLDLAIACANPGGDGAEESVIYWNSPQGFSADRKTGLPGAGVSALADDLNGDGTIDLALAQAAGVKIYWNTSTGLDVRAPLTMALAASHPTSGRRNDRVQLTAADIDGDRHRDLVAVGPDGVRILSGSAAGPRPSAVQTIPLENAVQAVAADLNRDGRPDLAVTRAHDKSNEYTDSLILWNDSGRFALARSTPLPTVWATGITAGDSERRRVAGPRDQQRGLRREHEHSVVRLLEPRRALPPRVAHDARHETESVERHRRRERRRAPRHRVLQFRGRPARGTQSERDLLGRRHPRVHHTTVHVAVVRLQPRRGPGRLQRRRLDGPGIARGSLHGARARDAARRVPLVRRTGRLPRRSPRHSAGGGPRLRPARGRSEPRRPPRSRGRCRRGGPRRGRSGGQRRVLGQRARLFVGAPRRDPAWCAGPRASHRRLQPRRPPRFRRRRAIGRRTSDLRRPRRLPREGAGEVRTGVDGYSTSRPPIWIATEFST